VLRKASPKMLIFEASVFCLSVSFASLSFSLIISNLLNYCSSSLILCSAFRNATSSFLLFASTCSCRRNSLLDPFSSLIIVSMWTYQYQIAKVAFLLLIDCWLQWFVFVTLTVTLAPSTSTISAQASNDALRSINSSWSGLTPACSSIVISVSTDNLIHFNSDHFFDLGRSTGWPFWRRVEY